MLSLLLFLVVIVVVVGIHEAGHYLAARSCGVRVLRFSIGFGKPLWRSVDRRGTEWCLSPIPLGGYVQMVWTTKEAREMGIPERESLDGVPRWQRAWIIFAGPLANFILALLLLFLLALAGEDGLRARIGHVLDGTMAETAGLAAGDDIIAIDGHRAVLWTTVFPELVTAVSDRDLRLRVSNSGSEREAVLPTASLPPAAIEDPDLLRRLGMLPDRSYLKLELDEVIQGSPAAEAGLQPGDFLIAIDEQVLYAWQDFVSIVRASPGVSLTIVYERGGDPRTAVAAPAAVAGDDGESFGRIGVIPLFDEERYEELKATESYGLLEAGAVAWRRTWGFITTTGRFFGYLVGGEISSKNLSGPVGIARSAETAAGLGLKVFLLFMAQISVSLGVINLVPLPLLDGGHLLRYAIEGVMRRPLPAKIIHLAAAFGAAAILALMVFAIYNDLT